MMNSIFPYKFTTIYRGNPWLVMSFYFGYIPLRSMEAHWSFRKSLLGLIGVRAERAATSARLGGGARAVSTSKKLANKKAPGTK